MRYLLLIVLMLAAGPVGAQELYNSDLYPNQSTGPGGAATGDIDLGAFKLTFDDKLDYIKSDGSNKIAFYTANTLRLTITASSFAFEFPANFKNNRIFSSTGALCLGGAVACTVVNMADTTGFVLSAGEHEFLAKAWFNAATRFSATATFDANTSLLDTRSHFFGNGNDFHLTYSNTDTDFTFGNLTGDIFSVQDGAVDIVFNGSIEVEAYPRHHDLQIGSATLGQTAPSSVTIGTFRCSEFDIAAESASMSQEIPSEWDGVSDMALEFDIFTESGDALANGEVIEFDVVYRSIGPLEAYDRGTAVTINPSVTGGGSEVEKGQYHISAAIPYNTGDQPLAVGDTLGFTFNRDVGASDTYSGAIYICKSELEYTAVRLGSH